MKAAKPFYFKQFKIEQEGATMKINTDGVLLAALASAPSPGRILDIGTGTGVISLMMAQRFPKALIEALEPEPRSCSLAEHNFSASPFASRLSAYPERVEDFRAPQSSFDLIVSNPPYFLNALKNDYPSKRIARHTDQAFFKAFFEQSFSWLKADGSLQLIAPHSLAEWLLELGTDKGFEGVISWEISSFPEGSAIRNVLHFSKTALKPVSKRMHLYDDKGVYSQFYKELLAPYFLNF